MLTQVYVAFLLFSTGLDPAGPSFDGTEASVRLDETDAVYVDAIHTNGDPLLSFGFGSLEQAGHADFYPNAGNNQPGCPFYQERGNPNSC